ncbi:hypothetical protein FS837_008317 [Tulasnella sp. UAMH 9824]|nr:hypothetical protein FS837_008317 [Tulasnella sp. UAMH 9824]
MNHKGRNGIYQRQNQAVPYPSVPNDDPNLLVHLPSPSPSPPAGRAVITATPGIGLLPPTPEDATFKKQLSKATSDLIRAQLGPSFDHQLLAPISLNQPSGPSLGVHLGSAPFPTQTSKPKTSHAKKQPEGHIKRPKNSFINFRSDDEDISSPQGSRKGPSEDLSGMQDTQVISTNFSANPNLSYKIAGLVWGSLRKEEKAPWEHQAREEQEMHRILHPDWRYAPTSRKKGSTASSSDAHRRRGKARMSSRDIKRIELIAKLFGGGAGRDRVRQRVKEFDHGVSELGDEDDSEMGSKGHEEDAGSDFEDSLSNRKAKRASARRAAKKKTTALPSLPALSPATAEGYSTPSHPAMPSSHSMTTRRRSLSTPSLPAVPAIASSLRKPKAHARTSSDITAVALPVIRISKGRTTNNSLSASTVFAQVPMECEESDDDYDPKNRTPSGREQKRKQGKKVKMQKELPASAETRASTPFTFPHPSTPQTFLSSTISFSSQSTPTTATPSLGYRTPTPGPGPSTSNSPFINAGWSLKPDFLNPPSSLQARDSDSQLLEEDLKMYGTLGLDEGPSSLMDAFGLGAFGELSGLDGTGEGYRPLYLLRDHYPLSNYEADSMEGISNIEAFTTQDPLSGAISPFTFPSEVVGTPEPSTVFDPAYSLSAPVNAVTSASCPAPDPVDPSHASEFDHWLDEDYFLSPRRGEKLLSEGNRNDNDLVAYRRGMNAADSGTSKKF